MRISVFERVGQSIAVATLAAALNTIGANFNTAKVPVTYSAGGKVHTVPDKVAVIRADTGGYLGTMGPDYVAMPNAQAFEVLEHVAKETGATYERGGVNKGKYFLSLRLPYSIAPKRRPDDKTELFLTGFNSFNGGCGWALSETGIRIVCKNTFAASLAAAFAKHKHSKQLPDRMAQVKTAIAFAIAEHELLQAKVDRLCDLTMTAGEMETFARRLFPKAKEGKAETKAENRTAELVRLFSSEQTGNLGRTRYDALNAVTEWADHFAPARNTEGSTAEENRFESVFFGDSSALKSKAADLLLA